MATPVDTAMADDRPAKQTIRRDLWLDVIKRRAQSKPDNVYLYATLAGAEGLDIALLIEEGLIDVTETGAIKEASLTVAVAIESNSEARSKLQGKYFGLEVLPEPFENLINGSSLIRYPSGKNLNIWQSLVVNLDLNDPLRLELDDGKLVLPLIENLVKVATIQRDRSHQDGWTLLLTLHSSLLVQTAETRAAVCQDLATLMEQNFAHSADYAGTFSAIVGSAPDAEYFESLCTVRGEDDDPETERLRQRTLLMLVPKLIVDGAASMGWSVTEGPSAFYGGGGDAPMATWVLDFALTAKAGASARIAASLASVGRAAISIDKDGSKVTLP
jgi:hypothetical protein